GGGRRRGGLARGGRAEHHRAEPPPRRGGTDRERAAPGPLAEHPRHAEQRPARRGLSHPARPSAAGSAANSPSVAFPPKQPAGGHDPMSRAVHRACVLLIILAAAVTAFRTAGPAGTTGDPD